MIKFIPKAQPKLVMKNLLNSINKYKVDIVFFLFASVYLSVILTSLYISDDTHNFLLGRAFYNNNSYFIEVIYTIRDMVWYIGRFLPGLLLFFPLHYLMQSDIIVYKIMTICLILVSLFVLGYLIKYLTKSDSLKFSAMLLTLFSLPLVTSYRHSPIYAMYGQMPIITIFILLAIICYLAYIDSFRKKYLFITICFFAVTILYYEMSYVFITLPALILIAYGKNGYNVIRLSTPVVSLFLFGVVVYFTMRYFYYTGQGDYSGVRLSIDLYSIVYTYFYQTFASFPLSEWATGFLDSGRVNSFAYKPSIIFNLIQLKDVVIVLLWSLFYFVAIQTSDVPHRLGKKELLVTLLIGLYLLLTPGILPSLTPKYQGELYLGVGYLPVFLQCFGAGVLCSILFYYVFTHSKRIRIFLKYIVWVLGMVFIIVLQTNARIALHTLHLNDNSYVYKKSASAIESNLFPKVIDDSYIVTSSHFGNADVPMSSSFFLSKTFKTRVTKITPEEYAKIPEAKKPSQVILFDTITLDKDDSFFIGMASSGYVSKDVAIAGTLNSVRIFIPNGYLEQNIWITSFLKSLGDLSIVDSRGLGKVYLLSLKVPASFDIIKDKLYQGVIYGYLTSRNHVITNKIYDFGIENQEFFLEGFWPPEGWARWSSSTLVRIFFILDELPDDTENVELTISGYLFQNPKININYNNLPLFTADNQTPFPYTLNIPAKALTGDMVTIDLRLENIQSPASIKELNNGDQRLLGIAIKSFKVEYKNN